MNWQVLRLDVGFLKTVGPIQWRRGDDGLQMRFRVDSIHCNPVGSCHGGMLATFADVVLGLGMGDAVKSGTFMPTIGLTCDFLAPAAQGSWVHGQAEVLHAGRSIGVARCLLRIDGGAPVVRASGTFKLDKPPVKDFCPAEIFAVDS